MTQVSGLHVEITGNNSDLKAALTDSQRQLAATGAAATSAAAKTNVLAGSFGRLATISGGTKAKIQNVGYQVQDMAIQFQMGTRATTVLAQQGSQLASVFGPIGAIIGTLTAVSLPLLAAAFASGAEKTKSFDDALGEVKDSLASLRDAAKVFSSEGLQSLVDKYGELNGELLQFIELQRQVAVAQALDSTREMVRALESEMEGFFSTTTTSLQTMFNTTVGGAQRLAGMLQDIREARTFEAQLAAVVTMRQRVEELTGGLANSEGEARELLLKLIDAEGALRELNAEGARAQGWLPAAIAGAADLAAKFWDAALAAREVADQQERASLQYGGRGGDPRQFMDGGSNSFGGTRYGTGTTPRGGGGGGTNPIIGQLEALQQSLLTQEELQIASYERQQEMLREALELRLITQEDYATRMEALQAQHAEAMTQIDAYRYGGALDKAGAFFGDMASIMANGNEKMLRASQVFAAAQAWISTLQGAAKELEKGTFGFATAAAVLAKGAALVSAINGVGRSGGGGGGAVSAATAAPQRPLEARLTQFNPNGLYTGASLSNLLDSLREEAGDRGYILMVPQ